MNGNTFNTKSLPNDILSGIIVALVSIPISMGYAQIACLPPVYGLYGSLLPILVFSLATSSPQFIVGVDAMPAAMLGSSLCALNVQAGTPECIKIVSTVTLLVSLWFVVFRICKAGRIIRFISNPVMGGFISGVGVTIILMQIPKLFGGNPGTGEVVSLLINLVHEIKSFNPVSFGLGLFTVVIILVFKKFFPKLPMAIFMLVLGIILTTVFKIDRYGVKLLSAVPRGLERFVIPEPPLLFSNLGKYIVLSFSISLVIMAQSLLTTKKYAQKYNYLVNFNQELTAYALMNLAGSLSGSCPINGSVSRTGMSDQFGSKTQIVSIVSFITMLLTVLFLTDYFIYYPVPVLTGIVISALIGIIDYKQAFRLFKQDKTEFIVFITAFLGVLLFGTIWGVLIGVILSFTMVVRKAVVPPRSFLGLIPGHDDFFNLKRNKAALPIKETVLYSFRGNLFFANIDTFENDILGALKDDTKRVIVDAHGIGNIDITASDRLVSLYQKLKSQGISFYITEHAGVLNDRLREYGAELLIEEGCVRRTVSLALRACGLEKPYPLEGAEESAEIAIVESDERLAEFEWAFGKDAEQKMKSLAQEMVSSISDISSAEEAEKVDIERIEEKLKWGKIGLFDEEELLQYFEIRLEQLEGKGMLSKELVNRIEQKIENRKQVVEQKVLLLNPKAKELLQNRHKIVEEHLRKTSPKEFEKLMKLKETIKNS